MVQYPYVVHAECNAILNKNAESLQGCTIYVALFPCNECTKLIIQSGIRKVYYLSDKYHNTPSMKASRTMLSMAGVEFKKYVPEKKSITITFPVDLVPPTPEDIARKAGMSYSVSKESAAGARG